MADSSGRGKGNFWFSSRTRPSFRQQRREPLESLNDGRIRDCLSACLGKTTLAELMDSRPQSTKELDKRIGGGTLAPQSKQARLEGQEGGPTSSTFQLSTVLHAGSLTCGRDLCIDAFPMKLVASLNSACHYVPYLRLEAT